MRSHDLRVRVCKLPLTNEKTHKPGEVVHDIRVILLGLQLCHLRVLELLNGQHLPCTADLWIVENIADLPKEHLRRHFRRHMFLILCECRIIPICVCKDGVLLVFFHGGLDQGVQNRLFIFKMAVEGRLANTDRFR